MIGKLLPEQFWDAISGLAKTSLTQVFGEDLQPQGQSFAVSMNKGEVSLGCLRTNAPPILTITDFDGKDKLRIHINQSGVEFSLSVTDIRFYEPDHTTLRYSEVHRVNKLLREEEVICALGLSKALEKTWRHRKPSLATTQ